MHYLKERVAYIKGLAEGMQINETTNEGKLLKAIIDVLDDVAMTVDDLEEVQEQLSEQVDEIDEDLGEIERIVFDESDDGEDEEFVTEVECPNCKEKIEVTEDMLDEDDDTFECPNCHEKIEFEWECGCEDCTDHE